MLQMKTTSNRRQPQNKGSGISQQLLVGSYPNLKLKIDVQTQVFECFKWGQPPLEDDLKN